MVHLVMNANDFDEQVEKAGDKLVVVDFFATWCKPCENIAPVLEILAEEYASKIVVLKVNVNACKPVARRFTVLSMPTFIFLKGGEQVESFIGANAEKLENTIIKLTK